MVKICKVLKVWSRLDPGNNILGQDLPPDGRHRAAATPKTSENHQNPLKIIENPLKIIENQ